MTQEFITDVETLQLQLANCELELANLRVKFAELKKENVVLKIAVDHKMSGNDAISQSGAIVRNAQVPPAPVPVNEVPQAETK